ncbi:uncharacterized protein LOC133530355 [Cydia pomonella]|uniref:uncharacterized protein LOC133530355 n=1 Tax=Cydia pomonella TaxID=82600 RepID=UPI002ADDA4E4|nr:uncharacterized protein LOC133530355 [Cydia pomonella]
MRLKDYYSRLLNETYPSTSPIDPTPPTAGPIPYVTPDEVYAAVKAMANNKGLGPGNIPAELWKKVPRNLIWQALRAHSVSECYIDIVKDMYNDVTTRVSCPAGLSDEFEVKVGVHQGSALSPLLFNIVMNYLTAKLQQPPPWTQLYADDIVLISKTSHEIQKMLEDWRVALKSAGLRISRHKTEYMHCNFTDADVSHRINTGWMKWKDLTGVLCDKRMPVTIKGKVYKAAVLPAIAYGAECWALKKQLEDKTSRRRDENAALGRWCHLTRPHP